MERGNSKHSRHLDEQLDAEARQWTRSGPGAGHAEAWRDIESIADDDGILTGIHWIDNPSRSDLPASGTPPGRHKPR